MGSFSAQNVFLCGLVEQTVPKTRRPRNSSRPQKSISNHYRFQIEDKSISVCKAYFLKTLQISDGRMTRAIKKIKMGQQPGSDNRGRHIPGNKISEEQTLIVREHISSFPTYQSHYTRAQNPNRRYLPNHLNIRLMYNLYKERCFTNNLTPIKEPVYRRIFNKEFNLHFHSPSKDTCTKCDAFKLKISTLDNQEEKRTLELEHQLHLRKAEAARESMKRDAVRSRNDDTFYAFTFDLQKALPFPILTTSVAYYKRNMYVYNLGCHELRRDLGFMYVWDETIASRGSQEVGSCVMKHIQTQASKAKHLVMYSDACTGQNRNLKFALFLMKLAACPDNSIEVIDHKFMVSGHSFLPNDSDFGSIELHARQRTIYVPDDWFLAITSSRKKKSFHLTQMSREDFKSVFNLEKCVTRRKKNGNNDPVSWLKIQWIRILKQEPFVLYYKETLSEDFPFSSLNLKPAKTGRPLALNRVDMEMLYQQPRKITKEKKKDMLDLLPYIPPVHHPFFQNLVTDDNVEEDIGPLDLIQTDD